MRVIRRNGGFGTQIEVSGSGPDRMRASPKLAEARNEIGRTLGESSAVVLARLLDRPIGRGGGLRDPLPGNPRERRSRDQYLATAVDRSTKAWVMKQEDERGLSRGAFVGMIIEALSRVHPDDLDDLLAK